MIPIKILCGCGQKYAFEVEPVGGRMAYAVQCPVCGAEGTTAANQIIAQRAPARPALLATVQTGGRPTVDAPPPQYRAGIPGMAPSSRKKGATKFFVPAICGIVFTALLIAGAGLYWSKHGQKQPEATAIVTPNDGLPHTLEELNDSYVEPPSGQNAAQYYLQGFNAMSAGNASEQNLPVIGKGTLPPLGVPMPASVKTVLSALIRANQDALQSFAQGLKHEQCRYPLDLTQGAYTPMPHLTKLRKAGELCELSAILHAGDKDGKKAADDILMVLGLARSLESEPPLISQWVRVRTIAGAVTALEHTVNRAVIPPESLVDLTKVLQKLEDSEARGVGFTGAATAEGLCWIAMIAAPQKLLELVTANVADITLEQRNAVVARLQTPGTLKEDEKFLDKTLDQLLKARHEGFPNRLKADALIKQRVNEAAEQKLSVAGYMLPGLVGEAAREATCLARVRLGLIAVALEQFRAMHENHYPSTLAELAPATLPAIPADPFDGQPLRYRTKANGFLLYSIGPDLKDDSGAAINGKSDDIAFTVITPPRRDSQ